VARCPTCTRQAAALRALSEAARAHLRRFEPPPGFEDRLLRRIRPRTSKRAWAGAALGLAAAAAVLVALPRRDALMDEAVAAHARVQLLALEVGRTAVPPGRRRLRAGDGSVGSADGRGALRAAPAAARSGRGGRRTLWQLDVKHAAFAGFAAGHEPDLAAMPL